MIDVAPVPYAEIERAARDHHAALPSPIDSYLDDLILASRHFRIDIAGEAAGFASIHELSLITQFAMDGPHRRYGQEAFRALRRLERVNAALESEWGRLFANWGSALHDAEGRGYPEVGSKAPELVRAGVKHFLEGMRLVGMAVKESPELTARKRAAERAMAG